MNLPEGLELISNGIFATKSAYDIRNLLINKPTNYKILYDNISKYYFIANGFQYIHTDIFYKAVKNGFYPDLINVPQNILYGELLDGEEANELCSFCFDPHGGSMIDFDRYNDGYPFKIIYSFGTIYERFIRGFTSFCPLYDVLGTPIKQEQIKEHIDIKQINMQLEFLLD